jgi:hypothetical protein
VRGVLEILPTAYQTFKTSFEQTFVRTTSAKDVLVSTLRARISNFRAVPGGLALLFSGDLATFLDRQRDSHRLIDCWEAPPYTRAFIVQDLYAYAALRYADLIAYCEILEDLPHPEFARQVIDDANNSATVEDLCTLLETATRAFGEDDKWISERRLPCFLLAACTRHLSNITKAGHSSDPDTAESIIQKSIEGALDKVLRALLTRPDGTPLGTAFWGLCGLGYLDPASEATRAL